MMGIPEDAAHLEEQLDSFDPVIRKSSLDALTGMADSGIIHLPDQKEILNLHCHTFFSYNGYGYSPSHIAWLGRKLSARFMGIVDFDVLDGVDEFLNACQIVGICGSAGVETRVYIPEYRDRIINSPGEPGIAYQMGVGFPKTVAPAEAAGPLHEIRARSEERNRAMLTKLNHYLLPLEMDYEAHVLPKTPSGNATERHMLAVIVERSFSEIKNPGRFWREKLDLPENEIKGLFKEREKFSKLVRLKLMKHGGVGYAQPSGENFPSIDDFHRMVTACGALPCAAWLDGTSEGERDIEALLGLMVEKGIAALNIVPDRNWNISDPEDKKIKLGNLHQVVNAARKLNLPLHIGTEMNSSGQKIVDDFDAPELMPFIPDFIDGAYFVYGHTRMQRHWGMGWGSAWAKSHIPDRKSRNQFFKSIGHLIPPGKLDQPLVNALSHQISPDDVVDLVEKTRAG